MVLPVRIELTTSALPRMRSTTELRQHFTCSEKGALWPWAGRRVKARCGKGLRGMAKRDEERERRLAEALRENLRRRKAQARGDGPAAPPPEPPRED